ncbi:MAG: hypothetical protein IT379_39735, partial [Deltaproteobacteria bacterium]|nr:hypothetical protein [Deltaproteobacteria bacterium]
SALPRARHRSPRSRGGMNRIPPAPDSSAGMPGSACPSSGEERGFGYTCARTSSAEVLCWGFNASGQLGDGTTERRSVPGSVLLAP